MKYRFLGNTGLLVSTFSCGSWANYDANFTADDAYAIVEHAFRHGINCFDNAEGYGKGQSEIVLGEIIQKGIANGVWTREDLVICTKLYLGSKGYVDFGPNDVGLSRKHIIEGTKASLKRLGLEYVDLLVCHRPDKYTPIEETVRAMNYVIDQGWALYWGTSEWDSYEIMEACEIADKLGLIRPVLDQSEYNILERSRVEYDYVNLYKKYDYGLMTWAPLASGILTGKYSNGFSEGTRLARPLYQAMMGNGLQDKITKADQLTQIAEELGCTLAQLGLAWCAANKNVSTIMIGATSVGQLDENLKAVAFVDKISPEIKAKIDEIVQFQPKTEYKIEPFIASLREKWVPKELSKTTTSNYT